MRRALSGRSPMAAQVAAVVVLALATGACANGAATTAAPTPLSGGGDLSFADLMTQAPESPSASPSEEPSPTAGSASASSTKSRTSAPAPRSAPSGASGPVSCPSGRVTGEITEFTTNEGEPTRDGVKTWIVRVRGTVLNQTSQAVRDIGVTVTIGAESAERDSASAVVSKWVGRNTTAQWGVEFSDYESNKEPRKKAAAFRVNGWSWGEGAFAQCPTPAWSS